MPKPLINLNKIQSDNYIPDISIESKNSFKSPELVFRRKRSHKYIDTLKQLDIIGHKISQNKIDEIINAIKNELPELAFEDFPIGIIAKCYLGEPYEVHTLSILGKTIIEHYKSGESL